MTKHQPPYGCSDWSPESEKKHCENKVVFNCGTGTGANLPVNSEVPVRVASLGSYQQPGLVIGTVTLDTSRLVEPSVKIDFSGIVNFKTAGLLFEIAITFQLSRSCNNGHKVPLATWTYEREVGYRLTDSQAALRVIDLFLEFKDPIAFTWCDCHDCPGCCTYFVEIVDVDSYDIDFAFVSNVGLNALAVG